MKYSYLNSLIEFTPPGKRKTIRGRIVAERPSKDGKKRNFTVRPLKKGEHGFK